MQLGSYFVKTNTVVGQTQWHLDHLFCRTNFISVPPLLNVIKIENQLGL